MKAKQKYQDHGLGLIKDMNLNRYEFFTNDVLDLASDVIESAPPCFGPITLMTQMFFIGYRTGVRAERQRTK